MLDSSRTSKLARPPVLVVALLAACNDNAGTSQTGDDATSAPTTLGDGDGDDDPGDGDGDGDPTGDGDGDPTGDGDGDPGDGDGDGTKFDVGGLSDGGGNMAGVPVFPTTCAEAEMSTTSVGCIFYPLALPGTQPTTGFMVSNVSAQLANVTFSDQYGQLAQAQVQPGETYMFTDSGLHFMSATTGAGDDGYVIESDQVLQVFMFMPPDGTVTADASIVLPGPALGTKHRVMTYNVHSNNTWQYAAAVATEDDTEVTFTLAQPGSQTDGGGGQPALDFDMGNDTLVVTIDRLDTLVIAGNWENNLNMGLNEFTGSLFESDKPIAVYSGKHLANIPEGACCADLIADAVPPTSVYGTEYAGVRFLPTGQPGKPDIWRFMGNADGTVIELSGDYQDTLMLDEGEFVDVSTGEVFWATGNLPFGLGHFMTAGSLMSAQLQPYDCAPFADAGDPAFGFAYPAGNWLNRYLFSPGTGDSTWCHDHATVVAPMGQWDQITMDGAPLPAPTPIGGGSNHGYAYIPVPNASHEIEGPPTVGIEVTVYGYVSYGSYMFPGGVGLQALNPEG
jgi:hypothetical protein